MIMTVFMESLGNFNLPTVENFPNYDVRMAYWFQFLLLVIITNLIVTNSLIAIIGDSYEKVMAD